MKNLQKNNPTIGAQGYNLVDKASEDVYVYQSQSPYRIDGSDAGFYFYNNPSDYYTQSFSVPNIPNLVDEIHFYVYPNPEEDADEAHYWYSMNYYSDQEYWRESDTGSRHLAFIPNIDYTFFAYHDIISGSDQGSVSELATKILTLTNQGNKLIFDILFKEWVFYQNQVCTISSVAGYEVNKVLLNSDNPYTF